MSQNHSGGLSVRRGGMGVGSGRQRRGRKLHEGSGTMQVQQGTWVQEAPPGHRLKRNQDKGSASGDSAEKPGLGSGQPRLGWRRDKPKSDLEGQ